MASIIPDLKKIFWWLVLAAACGTVDVALVVSYHAVVVFRTFDSADIPVTFYLGGVNAIMGLIAGWRLRALYRNHPVPLIGHWQIGLSEIVTLVFLFALTLFAFRIYDPKSVLVAGLPVAVNICGLLLIGLLFAHRIEKDATINQWVKALAFFFVAAFLCVSGILFEFVVIVLSANMLGIDFLD